MRALSLILLCVTLASCRSTIETTEGDLGALKALPGTAGQADPSAPKPETDGGAAVCGNAVVEKPEQCDAGKNNGGLCSKGCAWSQCQLDPTHRYAENEFPMATCLKREANGKTTDLGCTAAAAGKATHCYDCRGAATECSRLNPKGLGLKDSAPKRKDGLALADFSTFLACSSIATADVVQKGVGADSAGDSPFRFGWDVDVAAYAADPGNTAAWCVPKPFVNCAKWDDNPGAWRAPAGCSCYASDGTRSYDNCNDLEMFACPWASGSGCGLHFLGAQGGVGCEPGSDPKNRPQLAECHFDISGTRHDYCCAKHWYDDKSIQWYGKNIGEWECNGCGGGQGKTSCSNWYVFHNMSSPRNDQLPCFAEWDQAVAHNDTFGGSRYQWRREVDTEQRLTTREVVDNLADPALLGKVKPQGIDRRADQGQVLLKRDYTYGSTSMEEAAAFCKSGSAHVEVRAIGVDVSGTALWVCD